MKTKNIYCYLMGGLGNQLFQYSLARNLMGIFPESKIFIDKTYYYKYKTRNCELHNFILNSQTYFLNNGIPLNKRILFIFFVFIHRVIFKMLKRNKAKNIKIYPNFLFNFFAKLGYIISLDPIYHCLPLNKLKRRKNIYIWGYFQSVEYFFPVLNLLKHEFVPINYQEYDKKFSSIISNSLSCFSFRCSEIRKLGNFLGDIEPMYFNKVSDIIAKEIVDKKTLLFTEDCKMAVLFVPIASSFFPAYSFSVIEQFYLMQKCSTFFLSNSTFSWWGPVLSEHSNVKIYSPTFWYKNIKTKDIGLYYSQMLLL